MYVCLGRLTRYYSQCKGASLSHNSVLVRQELLKRRRNACHCANYHFVWQGQVRTMGYLPSKLSPGSLFYGGRPPIVTKLVGARRHRTIVFPCSVREFSFHDTDSISCLPAWVRLRSQRLVMTWRDRTTGG